MKVKCITVMLLVFLVLVPATAMADESTSDTALKEAQKSASQALTEVQKKAGEVKDWAAKKYENVKRVVEPAQPLGKTVVLQFSIDSQGQTTSVSTAISTFNVVSHWDDKPQSGHLNVAGTITPSEPDGAYLVICEGKLESQVDASVAGIDFSASLILKPGEKKLVAEKGALNLSLTLNVEPPPQK